MFMEERLLKLFELANLLDEKQDKVFAEIEYSADSSRKLEIAIRQKADFKFIDKCSIMLVQDSISKLDAILKLFEKYIGGTSNE